MGFGRPNRSAAGDQAAAQQLRLSKISEDTAQRDKIANISEQLDDETRLRRKRFGSRLGGGGSNFPIGASLGGGDSPLISALKSGFGTKAGGGLFGLLFRGLR